MPIDREQQEQRRKTLSGAFFDNREGTAAAESKDAAVPS